MKMAIYSLSGDPLTYGHMDIIQRAAVQFEKVLVAIGHNPDKHYLLTLDERVNVAKASLSKLSNVEVKSFEGLLVDFAYQEGASVLVRGIRNVDDFAFEANLNQVNNSQRSIETLLMFTKPGLAHVSSSNVKAIQKEYGDTLDYVPLPVKQLLENKLSGQCLMGITGMMGSGKSWVGEELERYSKESGNEILIHNIDLDEIAKEISLSCKPGYQSIKSKIYEHFGTNDRAEIARQAFNPERGYNNPSLKFLNEVYRDAIIIEFRNRIRRLKGIILVNSAILVERDMLGLCNNMIYVVQAPRGVRYARILKGRNISEEEVDRRSKFVLSEREKISAISKRIYDDNYGFYRAINNESPEPVEGVYQHMVLKSKLK